MLSREKKQQVEVKLLAEREEKLGIISRAAESIREFQYLGRIGQVHSLSHPSLDAAAASVGARLLLFCS